MRWRVVFIVGLLLFLLILVLLSRKTTLLLNDRNTKYPSYGEVIAHTDERLYIYPKTEGIPFETTLDKRDKYPIDRYDVVNVPPQDYLRYSVGRFIAWENIINSDDKYIVLDVGERGGIQRYRLGFESSVLFDSDGKRPGTTVLAIEAIWPTLIGKNTEVAKYSASKLNDLGFTRLNKLVNIGDVVVIVPLFAPPEYSKRDDGGHIISSWLILRRIGMLGTL